MRTDTTETNMSKRIDISNRIYGDILVIEFHKNAKTHALWKCLCMTCNRIVYVTYSNLENKNTKSCASCAQKVTTYKQECEISERLLAGDKVTHIAKDYGADRKVINRVKNGLLTHYH